MATVVRFVPKLKWLLIPLVSVASLRKIAFAKLCRYGHKIPASEARKMLRGSHYCSEVLKLLENLETDGTIRQIPEPGIPICIIWSEFDRILPLDQYSRPLMLAVPYAKLEYLHDAGHMPTYDQPEKMAEFIRTTIGREH